MWRRIMYSVGLSAVTAFSCQVATTKSCVSGVGWKNGTHNLVCRSQETVDVASRPYNVGRGGGRSRFRAVWAPSDIRQGRISPRFSPFRIPNAEQVFIDTFFL